MDILDTGAPERAQLEAIQTEILTIDQALEALEESSLTIPECEARLRGALSRLDPKHAEFHFINPASSSQGRFGTVTELHSLASLFIWTVGADAIVEKAKAHWLKYTPESERISAAERTQRERALREKRHQLLVQEEAEACRLEADGGTLVMRRAELDADALLEAWRALA